MIGIETAKKKLSQIEQAKRPQSPIFLVIGQAIPPQVDPKRIIWLADDPEDYR